MFFLPKTHFGHRSKEHISRSTPLGDVKPLNPQDYSVGKEFLSMWSKIVTSCHQASHKGLALSWHGDSRDNGNNGVPEWRGLCGSSGRPSVCKSLEEGLEFRKFNITGGKPLRNFYLKQLHKIVNIKSRLILSDLRLGYFDSFKHNS